MFHSNEMISVELFTSNYLVKTRSTIALLFYTYQESTAADMYQARIETQTKNRPFLVEHHILETVRPPAVFIAV